MVNRDATRMAFKFVILLGLVSLFADITYEGARSITGPYLALLGASATTVGLVCGFGELLGYTLRFISGYISDKTKRYWLITIIGYIVNLLAVPLLALAGRWEIAAVLMITERIGKAIRTPSRDAMLSYATKQIGRGRGFGLHEAMDQIGAMLGPLIVAAVLFIKGDYKISFAVLLLPALLAIVVLGVAKYRYPRPKDLEKVSFVLESKNFPRIFWIYLIAVSFVAAGYVDFPLIAYHFKKTSLVSDNWIPIFYALAMGVDALAAFLFGYLFDRKGASVIIFAVLLSVFFTPLVFLGNFYSCLLGIALWGIGMGAQESIMRAGIAGMVAVDKRGSAYGIFNAGYGFFWFFGSMLMGVFYDLSVYILVMFSVAVQLISIPFFIMIRNNNLSKKMI